MTGAAMRGIRRALKRLGFDAVRFPEHHPGHKRVKLLNHYGVDQIFDVGASFGGYARELRDFGYRGDIVSFEPLSQPYAVLRDRAEVDPRWTAVNLALGSTTTTAAMNVAANSSSSSFLPMRDAHLRAAPWAAYTGQEEVSVTRLDDIFEMYRTGDVPFLKMDVQGYEQQVLDGATVSLPVVRGVQLEMSLVPLYGDGWLFTQAMLHLEAAGFTLVSIEPGFYNHETGQLLQADGIFMRSHRPLPTRPGTLSMLLEPGPA